MIESNYSDRRFRRNEVIAALLAALVFHALLLCGFQVERPVVKSPEVVLPPVGLWDFDAMPESERNELMVYLAGNDPAAFAAGSQDIGFSYVLRTPDFRAALPPPESRMAESVPPLPAPETGVELKLAAPPPGNGPVPPFCSGAMIRRDAGEKVEFPLIDVDGRPGNFKLPAELRPLLSKVSSSESEILLSPSSNEAGLPRITVLRGCGVPELENWAVGAVIRSGKIETGRQINVRWRKE